ncbi:DEAD/DEAH box helicase [Bacillus salinus]|uniref:DEAD/DEAH box helicase n=1 Tax=Bacillus sp. HMF5848 TaxID=2495421 RepID=UPI0021AE2F02|nr:DEAD/DEAH box helicase [Bacillus sp. HMF5848]
MIDTMKPFIQEAWDKAGFNELTPIQQQALPLLIEGKDVLAQSPTGTGKTLAYLLPLLQNVQHDATHVQAIILATSHELVMQIYAELQVWAAGSGITLASFIGGVNMKRQLEKLKKRPQIVVGTPGRIHELIKLKKLKVHEVKTIVLDEGDQLLLSEQNNTVQDIVKSTLAERQVALFSATMSPQIIDAAMQLMNDPEIIRVKDIPASFQVTHGYIICDDPRDKLDVLRRIANIPGAKVLAFGTNIGQLNMQVEKLKYRDMHVGILHSETKKEDRAQSIRDFKTGKINLLVASDVAARGLDIKGITHVVNYDLPKDVTQYAHRSGRTGRLGSEEGTVISIITERDERLLKRIVNERNIPLQHMMIKHSKLMNV